MNELRPTEMTKEELEKIINEYINENARLKMELEICNKQLAMAMSREDLYREAIANLSKALMYLTKEKV